MKINLICVGKLKEKFYIDACNEYIKRLSPYHDVSVTEIPEIPVQNHSTALINKALEEEAELIIKKLNRQSRKIAMCIEGKQFSSVEFSEKLAETAVSGFGCIDIIIGGSNGLADKIKTICDDRISMSKMTFPHHLARVMVLEQIYRAEKINSNSKYHK